MKSNLDQYGEEIEGTLSPAVDKGFVAVALFALAASAAAPEALERFKASRVGRRLRHTRDALKQVMTHLGDDEDPWQE